MAKAVYWDTSTLLKLYAPEPDSGDYLQLLIGQREEVAISFLHRVELYFALVGKEARGEIGPGCAGSLFESFERHLSEGRYVHIPWGADVAAQARQALDLCQAATPPVILRSLDGLHLGAARAADLRSVVTTDIRMRQAANCLGLEVRG